MPFASGTFSLTSGNPVVTGTVISSTTMNNTLSDIATGLSTCVLKDGTQTITANLPMSGYKLTGLAAGSTAGDSLRYEQLVGVYLPLAGGTLTGNLLFTDATYDIGASGATRPRDLFLSRNAVVGGTINVTGHTTFEGVTSTGATGTGKLVYDTSPVIALNTASTAATQTAGDNSTKIATTAFVNNRLVTLGTPQATTSGTTITFTGIPSTAKKITINFLGVSTNGTNNYLIQLGSGSLDSSGYLSSSVRSVATSATSTAGFIINAANIGVTLYGSYVIYLENSSNNSWCGMGVLNDPGAATNYLCSGAKTSTAGVVDRVGITTVGGTDAFDAGEVNILYE